MISLTVYFEDNNVIETRFNGTFLEASQYYVGKQFNFGDTIDCNKDRMVTCVSIKECCC